MRFRVQFTNQHCNVGQVSFISGLQTTDTDVITNTVDLSADTSKPWFEDGIVNKTPDPYDRCSCNASKYPNTPTSLHGIVSSALLTAILSVTFEPDMFLFLFFFYLSSGNRGNAATYIFEVACLYVIYSI